jgi:hypothetical protein
MKHAFSRQIFEKSSNIKLHENLSCGSRVVAGGQTDTERERDGQTDGKTDSQTYMMELKAASRNFAKAPKKGTASRCEKRF